MLVVCAWCQREGKETIIKDGDRSGPISHGMCQMHSGKMLKEIEEVYKRKKNPRRRRRGKRR